MGEGLVDLTGFGVDEADLALDDGVVGVTVLDELQTPVVPRKGLIEVLQEYVGCGVVGAGFVEPFKVEVPK